MIIILAAAVILTISKNNPVESAKKATFVSDISAYQDELTMLIGQKYIDKLGEFEVASLDNEALENVVDINSKYNGKFVVMNGKIAGTDKLTEQEKEWAQSITGGAESVIPSVPFNYTDTDGKKAYIPTGFEKSEVVLEQTIATGLVVKDSKGNEFVWIPVEYTNDADFATKFTRKQGYLNGSLQTNLPYGDFSEPYSGASQQEIDEYNAMLKSVKKYHGYYIARYEMSQDASGNAQSKPNVVPWTNISCGNSLTDLTGGAVEKARAMYPVASATLGSAVSTLCYGVQWDTAIDFIENYGVKDTTYRKDSTGKGNYSLDSKSNTASNASYALNNIYDMAGNVWEWIMETYSSSYCTARGGVYNRSGVGNPVSCRSYNYANVGSDYVGFRTVLYIL